MNEEQYIADLCRGIKETVKRAAISPEVQEIKQSVKDLTREISQQVKSSVDEAVKSIPPPKPPSTPRVHVYNTPDATTPAQPRQPAPTRYAMLMKSGSMQGLKIRGIAAGLFGIMGTAFSVGLTAICAFGFLQWATGGITSIMSALATLLPAGACLAFGMMASRGFRRSSMAERFERYRLVVGNDRICPVKLLAQSVGKPVKFVQKDLARMIKAGWFYQAKLDNDKETLILDSQTYLQYLDSLKKARETQPVQPAKTQEAADPQQEQDPQLAAALRDGQEYIQRLRAANNLIAGEELSGKIDRMEQVALKIFYYVEQHPNKLPDIRRFMSYYLPTTLKLLEAYCRFDSQPVQGENITTTKREIEETLDTIIVAFENLLDSLFESEALDITTDISALEAMLAQEGLTGSDFNKTNE